METNEAVENNMDSFCVGNTVVVEMKVREGDNERIQAFRGIVIKRRGAGENATFTVRRMSRGEGVEKIFPLHSPRIHTIRVLKDTKSKRSKLYNLRAGSKRRR